MIEAEVEDVGHFLVAYTAEEAKNLHAMIVKQEEIERWGEGRVREMVAGIPEGKIEWEIKGVAYTSKL